VKPHPGAILPLAITVDIARDVLREAGFDPNVVTLAADSAEAPITKELVTNPNVRIVDYTGGSGFGTWIEEHAKQAKVYTEKAGVNSVIIDSVDELKPVTMNLAFTLSLYSGQMCTTSQNIFIPRNGIKAGGEHLSFDDVAAALVKGVNGLLGDPARACEVLGAIQNPATAERIASARKDGGVVLRESEKLSHERFPEARIHSPLIIRLDAKDRAMFEREMFGPVTYIIATDDTAQSIELTASIAREHGAITAAIYSTNPDVIAAAEEATAAAGVPLSCNLTGGIYVNQAAAFSDFHVSGGNPAGNATLCDPSFINGRFHIVQSRQLVPVEATAHAGV
ncbi:MAG: aldehyde dehydrogenase family protein, partial [Phycisphaerales bacterium]|nr:aldehyde dehydrogenase family protein [Phycisphaerales bacterium]